MQREEIIQICESQVLEEATAQFGTRKEELEYFQNMKVRQTLSMSTKLIKNP